MERGWTRLRSTFSSLPRFLDKGQGSSVVPMSERWSAIRRHVSEVLHHARPVQAGAAPHQWQTYRSSPVRAPLEGEDPVWDRMARIPGYSVDVWRSLRLALIGAGAGSLVGWAMVRKLAGYIGIYDDDIVELSNLPRQLYYPDQVFASKALSLAENLRREALGEAVIEAFPVTFQTAVQRGYPVDYNMAVCLVDNDETRRDVAAYFYRRGVPVVFAGFDRLAQSGYVFVQESRWQTPCFGCLFPEAVRNPRGGRCGPGSNEIVLTIAGLISWAVDSLLGNRPRLWAYKEISLAGYEDCDGTRPVPVKSSCPICGTGSALADGMAGESGRFLSMVSSSPKEIEQFIRERSAAEPRPVVQPRAQARDTDRVSLPKWTGGSASL